MIMVGDCDKLNLFNAYDAKKTIISVKQPPY